MARFDDDAHVLRTVLFEELVGLGFDRPHPTLVREIRRPRLRPICECCKAGAVKLTVGLEHEPGEEMQLDWLEPTETPWGAKAYVLVGALLHPGKLRGVFSVSATLIGVLGGLARFLLPRPFFGRWSVSLPCRSSSTLCSQPGVS